MAEAGQNPRIMLIGCCDSRVSPEVIFDAKPGELFVVRNIANLVPPYGPNDDLHGTSAALEFGVMGLGVEHVVLMGHASCGGVRAFVRNESKADHEPLSPGDFIGKWISLISAAAARIGPADAPLEDSYRASCIWLRSSKVSPICALFHGSRNANGRASSIFMAPISGFPKGLCLR